MRILSLTMKNFRQFYGEQTIEFANGDGTEIATVVKGENGRGKTGIYRAVLFALYGDLSLEQDDESDEIILTNLKALKEEFQKNNEGLTSYVQLKFNHQGHTYQLTREMFSIYTEEEVIERVNAVSLFIDDELETDDEVEVTTQINRILDERVKNYFFFDGERIERLTRASDEQRHEIAMGIKKLLKIDHLHKSKDVFKVMNKNLNKELEKHSSGEYYEKLRERTRLEDELEQNQDKLKQLKDQKQSFDRKVAQIDKKLSKMKDQSVEINKRKDLENRLLELETERENIILELKDFTQTLAMFPAKSVLNKVKTSLDFAIGERSNQVGVSSELLDELLEDLRCICGTEFDKEDQQYQQLSRLRSVVDQYKEVEPYNDFRAEIMELLGYISGKEDNQQTLKQRLIQKEQEIDETKNKIYEINNLLNQSTEGDLETLNRERQEALDNKTGVVAQIQNMEQTIDEKKDDLEKIYSSLSRLEAESSQHKKIIRKQEEVKKAQAVIDDLIKQYEEDLISQLEDIATQNLFSLLDESGQMNIEGVKILDDYSLEVENQFQQSFLANISQGQRQVLSLSFITALAQVAGGSETLEIPLFMDTPFGRLSGVHQENLLSFIPNVCSQWVLLVTDREFGQNEFENFKENQAIGKLYELKSVEPGVTTIVEQDIN